MNTFAKIEPTSFSEECFTRKQHFLSILFFLLTIFLIIPTSLYAGNDTCNGVLEDTLSSSDTSFSDSYRVRNNSDMNDYIYFNITETGIIDIVANDRYGNNYNFSVSKVSCGGTDLYARTSGLNHSVNNISVSNGDVIYVRIDAEGYTFNDEVSRGANFTINWSAVQTTWVKSADGLSATTDPSPYLDNSDASETLTISGATFLDVTISGTLETYSTGTTCGYDWVTVTDSDGVVSQKYCDSISTTFLAVGPTVRLDFHSDIRTVDTGVTVSIVEPPTEANNDSFDTTTNTPLTENVLTNDFGDGLFIVSFDTSTLSNGLITASDFTTGDFTYTPNVGFEGIETFTYIIEDNAGVQSTGTVTIDVSEPTIYTTGTTTPFELINPEETRNIRGNFAIAGNTVTCLTDATSGYNPTGACLNDPSLTSNNRVNRYINIDGNASTWNSTSSYITFPASFEPAGGRGIAWAGLFWQGRINSDTSYVEHFAQTSGTSFNYIETGKDSGYGTVDISKTNANYILLKTDTGSYKSAKARTLHQYASSGGETYAAFADVTNILRDQNLTSGKHTFTVANLTTNEGREGSPGLFGGWSLVIIYLQDFNGTPRNVSIYSGFDIVANPSNAIPITGFKLPSSGTVKASLGVFSGEGEVLYSPDSMDMSDDGVNYDPMPNDGSYDSNNVFDAKLTGITRDTSVNDTNVFSINNTGLDVDLFDVSDLVTTYRDNNPDIDTMYVRWRSGGDYITPSMMVFSTELYQPAICYDYTYDFAGYVIPSENSDINTSFQALGIPLTTHLTIRSIEGDFDLSNTIVTVDSNLAYLTYVDNSAAYAGNSINTFTTMYPPELNVTAPNTFRMAIGSGADATGGVIHPFETHYMRFQHDLNVSQDPFDTRLNISLDYTTDFGSGPVPIHKNLTIDNRCTGYTAYRPEWGIFNVIDADAPNINTYNLKTQITKRNFNAKVVGYGGVNFDTAQNFDTDIEVEVFNVGIYGTDTNVSCNNPDSNISAPRFYSFTNTSSVDMLDVNYDRSNQNSGFRVWYLEDKAGNLVNHHSGTTVPGANEAYFDTLYTTSYPDDGNCTLPCSGAATGCYACLKTYYGKPLCSRDNFSIRPENFKLTLRDNAENTSGTGTFMGDNSGTTPLSIAGAYKYQLDLVATDYGVETPSRGYVQEFPPPPSITDGTADIMVTIDLDKNHTSVLINNFSTNTNCNDFNGVWYNTDFWDGAHSIYSMRAPNVGEYMYHILDSKWTFVDNPGNFGQDCLVDDSSAPASGLAGCNISSKMDTTHNDLNISSVPYQFDTSGVATGSPALAAGFMYSNQLDNLLSDENMSLRFSGLITAQGKDGTVMSNFVTQCYSKNLVLDLDYSLTGEDINGVTWTQANGTLAEGNPIRWRELNASLANGTFPLPLGRTETMGNFQDVNLTATEFSKAAGGSTMLDLYLNIDRGVSTPHNPIQASFNSFNVICENGNCDSIADQVDPYTAIGTYTNLTPIINIFYGRAHTPRYRIQGNAANLRSYYEVYCQNCNVPRLQIVSPNQLLSVDDIRWFQNTIHTQATGEIPVANPMTTQNPVQAARLVLGANLVTNAITTADYIYDGTAGYPFKTTVNYIPDPWLIYNRFNNAALFNSFELEFSQVGGQAGKDNSGTHMNATGAPATNRRIQW